MYYYRDTFISIQLKSLSLRVILWDAKKAKNITFRGEVRNITACTLYCPVVVYMYSTFKMLCQCMLATRT